MSEHPGLSFGPLLRQLRSRAQLTQEELAKAAKVSPRSISDLERGISRTARKGTALLLAEALGLAGPARELFVAVARGQGTAAEAGSLAAAARSLLAGRVSVTGGEAELARLVGAVIDSPYRGLSAFEDAGRGVLLRPRGGHHAGAGADVAAFGWRRGCWWCRAYRARASRRCCGRACCRGSARRGWRPQPGAALWPCLVFTPGPRAAGRAGAAGGLAGRDGRGRGAAGTGRRSGRVRAYRAPGRAGPAPWAGEDPGARRRTQPAAVGSGCCWWWTSSSSCSPSAPMRGNGGRSSPPCTRPRARGTGPTDSRGAGGAGRAS